MCAHMDYIRFLEFFLKSNLVWNCLCRIVVGIFWRNWLDKLIVRKCSSHRLHLSWKRHRQTWRIQTNIDYSPFFSQPKEVSFKSERKSVMNDVLKLKFFFEPSSWYMFRKRRANPSTCHNFLRLWTDWRFPLLKPNICPQICLISSL